MTSQIKNITVLTKHPKKEEAKALLDRIAATVLPAMKRHQWEVKTLAEFYPENDALHGLNVNRGQSIKVRLRDGKDASSFLPFEHCLGTMIHELVHMEIGPHSAEFYKAMDALWDEVEKDMSGSLTNAAVYAGQGVVLGGANASSVRDARLAHLSKKQRWTDLAVGSGTRLGGRQDWKNMSQRELALAAAERRLQDARQCGADMLADDKIDQSDAQWICGVCTAHNKENSKKCHFCSEDRYGSSPTDSAAVDSPLVSSSGQWYCSCCSYSNTSAVSLCSMCHTSASSPRHDWACNSCTYLNKSMSMTCSCCGSQRSMPNHSSAEQEPWICATCTYENQFSSTECAMCYTSPVDTQASSSVMSSSVSWMCGTCTFRNGGDTMVCAVCDSILNSDKSDPQWTCSQCSTLNSSGEILCVACSYER